MHTSKSLVGEEIVGRVEIDDVTPPLDGRGVSLHGLAVGGLRVGWIVEVVGGDYRFKHYSTGYDKINI